MAETASLVIKVDSSGAKRATDDLDKLTGAAGKTERQTGVLTTAWKAFTAVAASAALTQAASTYIRLADASANMSARLRLATRSQEEFNRAHAETYNIAQRTSTELGSVVDLYAKLSQSTGELGLTQDQVLQMTETITQAFQLSGATAQEAAGGLRQIGQAMAGGTLRAEEFNSIIESSPRLVQALADYYGISFGRVRQYVNEGKVSSLDFANATLEASKAMGAEFSQMPLTVSRATTKVQNALAQMVGETEGATSASGDLAKAIDDLVGVLESQETKDGFTSLVAGIASIGTSAVEAIAWLGQLDAKVRESMGMAGEGPYRKAHAQDFFGGARDAVSRLASGDFTGAGHAWRRHAAGWGGMFDGSGQVANFTGVTGDVLQPSFAGVTGSVTSDSAAKPSATAGITQKAKAVKELTDAERAWLEMEREIAAHEEQSEEARREYTNAQLQRLRDAEDAIERQRAATDDLVAEMEFELSLIGKSAIEQEKMIALRIAGANATDEQRQKISDLIDEMARVREDENALAETEDAARRLFATIATDSSRASEALDRFFDNLKRRLAEKTFDALLAGLAGMGGGGGWAGFASGFAGAWGGQLAVGGPVQAGQGYIVGDGGKPELFVPGQSGRVYPMGGSNTAQVKLEVINNGQPAQAQVSQQTMPDGSQLIRLVLNAVAEDVARGGVVAAAGKSRYGWREAL